jgi:hypothetical protein
MKKRAWLPPAILGSCLLASAGAVAGSVQFFGNGTNDIDRIKIRLDDPATDDPGPPADIGATDFTIEFWIKGNALDNTGVASCGDTNGWTTGNRVLDRERLNQPRSFGISLSAGAVAFGAEASGDVQTLCGSRIVLDGNWHHVAVTRAVASGVMRIFVDGFFDGEANGPVGDISYPDDGVPAPLSCAGGPCVNDPFMVLGAEQHDLSPAFPSFRGQLDELRLSTTIRYTTNFAPSTQPFNLDGSTAALYHLDETGDDTDVSDVQGRSPGVSFPGGTPKGPEWVDDTPFPQAGAGTLQFASRFYPAVEGSTLHARVARTGGTSGAASVLCTSASGTAASPDDFVAVSTLLTWAAGDRNAKNCDVTIAADAQAEATESFTLQLSNPSGASLGVLTSADVDINEDISRGVFRFTQATAVVGEAIGTFNLAVSRTGATTGAVTITVTGDNGTANGLDFSVTSPTLSWADGEAGSKNVTVSVVDDGAIEGDETFTVRLAAASAGGGLGTPSAVAVTITDDDSGGGGGGGGGSVEWWTLLVGIVALIVAAGAPRRLARVPGNRERQ